MTIVNEGGPSVDVTQDYLNVRYGNERCWPTDPMHAIDTIYGHKDGDTSVLFADLRTDQGKRALEIVCNSFQLPIAKDEAYRRISTSKGKKFGNVFLGIIDGEKAPVVVHGRNISLPRELQLGISIAGVLLEVSSVPSFDTEMKMVTKNAFNSFDGDKYIRRFKDDLGREQVETFSFREIQLARKAISAAMRQ